MNEQMIRSVVKDEGGEKETKCSEAFAIPQKYGISETDIAWYCNTHGVKIRACQLGCFK
jgi:hypothetical protein